MIEAVLFDCDGVLVDSEQLSKGLMVDMLGELGIEQQFERVLHEFSGRRMDDCLDEMAKWLGKPLPTGFTGEFRRREYALLETRVTAIPGIHDALTGLGSLPRAVGSNGPMEKIRTTLGATDLISYFGPHIYSAYDRNVFKPDPDLYLHAAAKLGVPPARCAVVEDSVLGARAGVSAGMTVYAYGERAAEIEKIGGVLLDDMAELPQRLGKND